MVGLACLAVGVYLVGENQLTTGALIACTILAGRALAPLSTLASLLTRYHQSMSALAALNKIMEACTWKREEVYILNTLKCRPPDNRPPEQNELANCRPFWERQLEILQPEYIVCLGTHAAQSLLETGEAIGRLRNKFFTYRGSKVIATYHPSYLLRSPDAKKLVWDDMQMLLKDMGIELPKKA